MNSVPVQLAYAALPINPESLGDAALASLARTFLHEEQQAVLAGMQHNALRRIRTLGWCLRNQLLGLAAQRLPAALRYARGEHGKPHLQDFPNVHFSLSHSATAVVVAVADQIVGVDMEQSERPRDWLRLAPKFCTASQFKHLQACDQSGDAVALHRAGLNLWTAKEAWVKAQGEGLAGWSAVPNLEPSIKQPWQLPKGAPGQLWQAHWAQHYAVSLALPEAQAVLDVHCHYLVPVLKNDAWQWQQQADPLVADFDDAN